MGRGRATARSTLVLSGYSTCAHHLALCPVSFLGALFSPLVPRIVPALGSGVDTQRVPKDTHYLRLIDTLQRSSPFSFL